MHETAQAGIPNSPSRVQKQQPQARSSLGAHQLLVPLLQVADVLTNLALQQLTQQLRRLHAAAAAGMAQAWGPQSQHC